MTNATKFTIQRSPAGLGRVLCARCRAWEKLGPIPVYPGRAVRQAALDWANEHISQAHPLLTLES